MRTRFELTEHRSGRGPFWHEAPFFMAATDGDDTISGTDGDDAIDGGDGDDVLVGNVGIDVFSGAAGVDQFVFGKSWGGDFIADFEDGVETIDLRATGLTFADLTFGDDNGTVLISSSRGTISLTIAVAQLTAADFIFA